MCEKEAKFGFYVIFLKFRAAGWVTTRVQPVSRVGRRGDASRAARAAPASSSRMFEEDAPRVLHVAFHNRDSAVGIAALHGVNELAVLFVGTPHVH